MTVCCVTINCKHIRSGQLRVIFVLAQEGSVLVKICSYCTTEYCFQLFNQVYSVVCKIKCGIMLQNIELVIFCKKRIPSMCHPKIRVSSDLEMFAILHTRTMIICSKLIKEICQSVSEFYHTLSRDGDLRTLLRTRDGLSNLKSQKQGVEIMNGS